jgi:hypothetical protein
MFRIPMKIAKRGIIPFTLYSLYIIEIAKIMPLTFEKKIPYNKVAYLLCISRGLIGQQ